MDPEEGKDPAAVAPTTIKVGDKEYTPEEIEKLEKSRDFFQTESQKVKEEMKTLQDSKAANDLSKTADDVISGKVSATELTAQQIEDLKYMESLGFITPKKLEEVISKVKEDTTKEVEEKLTKKELLEKTEKEIKDLKSQHDFIDEEELKKYMTERAEGKNGSKAILSVEEAAMILYKAKFLASGIKPDDLPGMEKGKKQSIETPKPKVLTLGSRAMSEHLAEKLKKIS
jgi:type I site-specific restriction-modification system R (restriction) subunit